MIMVALQIGLQIAYLQLGLRCIALLCLGVMQHATLLFCNATGKAQEMQIHRYTQKLHV